MKLPAGRDQGFTLIELLMSMALLGLVLACVFFVYLSTSRSSAALQSRNQLLEESQTAQNYITGKLGQAAYVFPSGTSFSLGSGYSTQTPVGGHTWVIGKDPVVAFVLPPRKPVAGACKPGNVGPDICYAFYAFFAMKRGDLTASAAGVFNPGVDAGNDSAAWVLMEYRASYTAAGYTPTVQSGGQGRLLMDYLRPTSQTGADVNFLFRQIDGLDPESGQQMAGVTAVTLHLAAQRSVVGQAVSVPTGDVPATLTVYPRNVGKPPVAN